MVSPNVITTQKEITLR